MVFFGGKPCLQQKFYILMKQALAEIAALRTDCFDKKLYFSNP
jgi:hypothetical protein